jgi:hypothetical protein
MPGRKKGYRESKTLSAIFSWWATRKDRNPIHSYSESKLDAEP